MAMRAIVKVIAQAIGIALAAVVGMVVGGIATFWLVASTESCPPQVRTCDLAATAGAGLALVVAPITGLVSGWLAIRYYQRWRGGSARSPSNEALQRTVASSRLV